MPAVKRIETLGALDEREIRAYPNGRSPKILETGERLVFQVSSHSRPDEFYRVDLEAENLLGACECPDFQFRQLKLRRSGYGQARCIHLHLVRSWLADKLIAAFVSEHREKHGRKQEWYDQ